MNLEPATIIKATIGYTHDHGLYTFLITINYDSGGTQGFGHINLVNDAFLDYVKQHIPTELGVDDWDSLVGTKVMVDSTMSNIKGIQANGDMVLLEDLIATGNEFYI